MTHMILGENGQVGRALEQTFAHKQPIVLDRQNCDMAAPEQIAAALEDCKPRVILNAAAYTAVDAAEDAPKSADAINPLAPAVLAEWATANDALFLIKRKCCLALWPKATPI